MVRAAHLGLVLAIGVGNCSGAPVPAWRAWPAAPLAEAPPPPRAAAWTPPATSLPASVVSATAALFGQGMADPRGCAYREIEIAVGTVWKPEGGVVRTHGWVCPERGAEGASAIAWNGLVYRAVAVGAAADLTDDVLDAVEDARRPAPLQGEGDAAEAVRRMGFDDHEEQRGVSATRLASYWVVMLLRLGEAGLAELAWSAQEWSPADDPYPALVASFVWALFDRAVRAHMRGDDTLALASARAVSMTAAAARAESARRGSEPPLLSFLDPLPSLLADQERRARDPRSRLAPGAMVAPERRARIEALMLALDEVSARQQGQPGGVDLAEDWIVRAIIREGAPAIEPLLDVLEEDDRLTRSVSFDRDFQPYRSLIGVHEAAYEALARIYETDAFGSMPPGEHALATRAQRSAMAEQIRAFRARWRGVSPEGRWHRTLADDAAGAEAWIEAAERITGAGDAAGLRGEALRAGASPSVSELFARRLDTLDIADACRLVRPFLRWDQSAALPSLARLMRRAVEAEPGGWQHGRCIAALTLARVAAGDRSAPAAYARWVPAMMAYEHGNDDLRRALEPLWLLPGDEAIAAAAETLFGEGSSWMPLVSAEDGPSPLVRAGLLQTPLLTVPSFQARVIRELASSTVVGSVQNDAGVSAQLAGIGYGAPQEDALPGMTSMALRAGDFLAWLLSSRPGAPAFRLTWSQEKRDEARAAMVAHVRGLR